MELDLTRFQRAPQAPVKGAQVAAQVNENPTPEDAAGMRIALGPETSEVARVGQYSSMFSCWRVPIVAGAAAMEFRAPNIPRYWAVRVNPNSAAGSMVQVTSMGGLDFTLAVGEHAVFPGRALSIWLTVTVANADVSVFNLGDDQLVF